MQLFFLVVGRVTSEDEDSSVDFVFKTEDQDEALHVAISVGFNTVFRYAVLNGTVYNIFGNVNDGTTIDLGEPFEIRIACDGDGWVIQINDENSYSHFLHVLPPDNVDIFEVSGDVDIGFAGFGNIEMSPAPDLSFNMTFECPPGKRGFHI